MKHLRVTVYLFILHFVNFGNCSKILAVFTIPSKSHAILAYELLKELVQSGHEVTMISPYGQELENPPVNFTNIQGVGEDYVKVCNKRKDQFFEETDVHPIVKMREFYNFTTSLTLHTLKSPEVQKLLKSNIKFDLVISEIFMNEAVFGFSQLYKCPHVLLSTVGATRWVGDFSGNPYALSYIPHPFLGFTNRMSFIERFQNVLFFTVEKIMSQIFQIPQQENLYDEVFPDPKPKFRELLEHGTSLILLNSHFSIDYPQPHLPNLIEVAGMHIKKQIQPLPTDIQKFLDYAEDGVVYFSMGSNLNPSKMTQDKKEAIIKSLSKLKQKVIWKWDDEHIVTNEKFMVKKWIPQDSVLAHPNTKLFVTHGGIFSLTESMYYGVPIVGIPFFGDQLLNLQKAVVYGLGQQIAYTNLTEDSLTWALNEVLTNEKYLKKVASVSKRFRDQPEHPLDRAKFWVEYVIRNKGAPYMHSSAQHLNFIEYNNIDVIVIIVICLFLSIKIFYWVLKNLFSFIFRNNRKLKQKSQ